MESKVCNHMHLAYVGNRCYLLFRPLWRPHAYVVQYESQKIYIQANQAAYRYTADSLVKALCSP